MKWIVFYDNWGQSWPDLCHPVAEGASESIAVSRGTCGRIGASAGGNDQNGGSITKAVTQESESVLYSVDSPDILPALDFNISLLAVLDQDVEHIL